MYLYGQFQKQVMLLKQKKIFIYNSNSIGVNNVHFSRAQLVVNNSTYYPELSVNANEKTNFISINGI